MKVLSAGLTFFNFSTVCAVFLGLIAGGLGPVLGSLSLFVGAILGVLAYFSTYDPGRKIVGAPDSGVSPAERYRSIWFWLVAGVFAIFAVRSFCWLLYVDGNDLRIQSVNNLGDLALHVTYIKTFANGIPLWPDNPIYVFSRLRYPAGVDLFNALLCLVHVDLIQGLAWVGLLASVAALYAFYRWGGVFAIAAFLFNGGVAGFQYFNNHQFHDYQGVNSIAWKSIALSMFVTQRGLLYSIPAALLLLWHWREKFYGKVDATSRRMEPSGGDAASTLRSPLPFWVELGLYATMPLFHVHTFLALSVVLVFLFAFGDAKMRMDIGTLVAGALIPATFFVWLITDHFHAASMLKWQPGWVQRLGDFAHPLGLDQNAGGFLRGAKQIFDFWFINFGFFIPLVVAFIAILILRARRQCTDQPLPRTIRAEIVPPLLALTLTALVTPFLPSIWWSPVIFMICSVPLSALAFVVAAGQRIPIKAPLAFTTPALALFMFGYLFKTAPWEWDNLKLMFWGYFLVLPFLWRDWMANWILPLRVFACIALFASGFVSLFGGLATPGFGFANRAELDGVGVGVRNIPVEARFAAYPTYNHPLLLQGRKVVLGYPGHLWTQGFDYHLEEAKLNRLMLGEPDWREAARALRVRYIFWGREEQTNYPTSKKPWEQVLPKVESGTWGAIYDLGSNS
jgi:hypothetical protein